ncbi:MAG: Rho termination factor N-terminal domain-containing protein, partial [Nocardioides sp.]|nr:Rho termination factor N-terminal domain-containing protein [Nocardioides sp.]
MPTDGSTPPDAPASGGRARGGGGGGLSSLKLPELKQLAGGLGIKGTGGMRKGQLVEAIQAAQGGGARREQDKPRDEKPRDEKPRDEKPRDEKPRDEKP